MKLKMAKVFTIVFQEEREYEKEVVHISKSVHFSQLDMFTQSDEAITSLHLTETLTSQNCRVCYYRNTDIMQFKIMFPTATICNTYLTNMKCVRRLMKVNIRQCLRTFGGFWDLLKDLQDSPFSNLSETVFSPHSSTKKKLPKQIMCRSRYENPVDF